MGFAYRGGAELASIQNTGGACHSTNADTGVAAEVVAPGWDRIDGGLMSKVVGGSWDGVARPGLLSRQRELVLNKRLPDGSQDTSESETYFRHRLGGPWHFWHRSRFHLGR